MTDLGSCCICGTTQGVRSILLLPKRNQVPGHGWGCLACRLPCDGASAVLCDGCFEAFDHGESALKYACRGWPAEDGRVPIAELTEPFDHNPALHPELKLFTGEGGL